MKRYLALTLIAGCTAAQAPLPPQSEDTCGASEFAHLIGQQATALERTLLLGPVRVIRPGDAVTMDFRTDRVNFRIGEDETIQRIDCG
ncbi:Peptidase inhibitor I78 family protein [Yoonia rosea]|uniref:Peptidase inhibitor I78 family protein n=1 Tax=Yoonia rosea TaxID=287098 RepID=A0A1R3X4C9_9RHOB|nr:I78 family peptidase inhibitor [Yoonia rosea]SIT85857.1 Peptidase inhibitor I78 family protein [Yoonia rosea]